MLYDKRWDKTKADPFSLESLVAWLEMQPMEKKYDYKDCAGECLYGLYVQSCGIPWAAVFGAEIYSLPPPAIEFKRMVYHQVAKPDKWTFGAALKRARKLLAQS